MKTDRERERQCHGSVHVDSHYVNVANAAENDARGWTSSISDQTECVWLTGGVKAKRGERLSLLNLNKKHPTRRTTSDFREQTGHQRRWQLLHTPCMRALLSFPTPPHTTLVSSGVRSVLKLSKRILCVFLAHNTWHKAMSGWIMERQTTTGEILNDAAMPGSSWVEGGEEARDAATSQVDPSAPTLAWSLQLL